MDSVGAIKINATNTTGQTDGKLQLVSEDTMLIQSEKDATFTANGALIYNDTQSDKAVAVIAFGADKTVTSGTFTIQFPTADASNAIIRIA